ncbi:Gldg family protein [Chloroflexota bacterium]
MPSEENRLSGLIAVLGLIALLVGLVLMVISINLRLAALMILALGVALLIIAFIIDFKRVGKAITGRRGKFSTGTTVMVSIFIGIALLANAISIGNYHRFDVTGVSQFTLTSQTKAVLEQMEIPVKAICFFTPNDPYNITTYATTLLDEYKNFTDQLSVETIDPDEHPDTAKQYGITQYQTVVFESEIGRRLIQPEYIVEQAEHAFTSAILEVTGVEQKKVYFLTGHNEADIEGNYSYALQGLLDNLYTIGTLDIQRTLAIPNDCDGLIIAGPQKSLTAREVEIIQEYLENDGWLMVLLNPNPQQEIRQILSEWWIDIEDGTVIDASSYVSPNQDNPIIPRTRNEFGLSETYFPGATAVRQKEDTPDEIFLLPLFYTSGNSWLEKNYDPAEEPEFNEGVEEKGSQALGVLVATIPPEEAVEMQLTRIIVIGDSDFASNQHFYNGDNGNLFLNCVELLTTGTELISIERKVMPFRRMLIEPEEQSFIQISSIGLLPLLVLIGGGIIWWRRR